MCVVCKMWLRNTAHRFLTVLRFLVDLAIDFWFSILYWKHKSQPLPPISDEILLMSATKLAEKIRQKELSSVEVVQAFISRIKEVNSILNAVVDNRCVVLSTYFNLVP